jgi:YD repeat-containing protein
MLRHRAALLEQDGAGSLEWYFIRLVCLDYPLTIEARPTTGRQRMKVVMLGLLGIVLAVTSALAGDNGLVSKPSKYPVAETITRLEGVLKTQGMTIFVRLDHQAEAEKVGLQMRPAQLLIFGNPKGGTPLMVASPTAAIDLPLKALAWEDARGQVWLSYNALSYLRTRHDIQGQDALITNLDRALDALTTKALE